MTEPPATLTTRCGVCRWPATAAGQCRTCGWHIPAGVGPIATPVDSPDPDLQRAQRTWDRAAARRAAGSDARHLHLLDRYLRGSPQDEATVDPDEPRGEAPESPRPAFVINDPDGHANVVAVGPDGIEIVELGPDPAGRLDVVERQYWSWAKLLPSLAQDPVPLRFHVAGGIGTTCADPVGLAEEMESNLPLTSITRGSLLFILTEPGWHLVARVVESLRKRTPGAVVWHYAGAEETLRRLVRSRPLDEPYHLVLSHVGPDRGVLLDPVLLFPAGTLPGATATVAVWIPPDLKEPICLPVVACQNGHDDNLRDPREWLPVRIGSVELPAGKTATVQVRLGESNLITFAGIPEVRDERRRWSELLATVSTTAVVWTDLVLVVDYTGTDAPLRFTVARAILRELVARLSATEVVRVTLLGYGQHETRPSRGGDGDLLRTAVFPSAAKAEEQLATWAPEANRDDVASALEDALAAITGLSWLPGARRIAVLVGSKPPYPTYQARFDPAVPCPMRLDWRDYADRLRRDQVSLVVLHEPPNWPQRGRIRAALNQRLLAWHELGSHCAYDYGVPPSVLVTDAGLLGGGTAPPPPFARRATEQSRNATNGGHGES